MVTSAASEPLVAFLYLLIRDYISSGDVERIMAEVEYGMMRMNRAGQMDAFILSRGNLAAYAREIAIRLSSVESEALLVSTSDLKQKLVDI